MKHKKTFGTAQKGGKLAVRSSIDLEIRIEGRWIRGEVLVVPAKDGQVSNGTWMSTVRPPRLGSDMLIGAGLMQMWDISIRNKNGHTKIHVGHDMNDPDIQTVL